ncbi:MAG: histidine phosphatase family protein [Alphaproteobacteria bacterium]
MHFIRHGQSHFNLGYEQSGRDPQIPDAPLTPHGFEQARGAAALLAGKGIRQIISSPYTRALQTASVLAETLSVGIHIEPLAGERCLYSCDIGTPASVLRAQWQHLDFSALDENWWPQMNESSFAVSRRIKAFKEKWGAAASSGGFVLVSHWYFLNSLTNHDFANCEVVFKELFSGKHKSFP